MSAHVDVVLDSLDPFRLPRSVTPNRYDIRLRPDLDAASFDGTVSIDVEVNEATATIVLNSIELGIGACVVDGADVDHRVDEATERLILSAPQPIEPGAHTIVIDFTGVLNDKLRGFYRSTYVDDAGDEQVIATTQMQATDCRRAFPCWDEPDFKAIFAITLDVETGLQAISNQPEIGRVVDGERTVITFADTMVMSTYLVAFIVGRLEMTEPVDVGGTPMRVVHVPGKSHLTQFGLDTGVFCLRWFEEYYGIPYPGDKVDLIGLPDFAAGAMENLGCITFRESLLLVDPATSTQNEQQLVVDVVAHELAHMWFGDLVTMRWWNGIWLNEAFATFMEIAACDAYRPDWQRWTSFGLERSVAFETDSLDSTRSVEYEVLSPADCEGMFDVLTYQKGGALLRMLEQYLRPPRFRDGVSHYLRSHSYANTETNDLWDAIEETSGEPVRQIMDSWIWQPGFPLISASLVGGPDGSALQLSQQRFSFDAADTDTDAGGTSSTSSTWMVPVHVRQGQDETVVLLDGTGTDTHLPLTDGDAPVVVNAGGHGFFRVAYDGELRGRLTPDVLAEMSTLERFNLVDDAWAATVAGRLGAVDLLKMLDGFDGERDLAVWQAITIALRGLGRLVDPDDEPAAEGFRARVRRLVAPAVVALGEPAEAEPDLRGKLRGLLTATLGVLGGDVGVRGRARELYDAAEADPTSIDPELTAAATSIVATFGDVEVYERMQQAFLAADTPQRQLRHMAALAEFDDEDLILRTCEFAMSGRVKTQNAPFLLRMAIANRRHGPAAWAFVRDRWSEANEAFPSNTIVRMIDSVKLLTDAELVEDVHSFFSDHPIEQAAKTLQQILERQRVNARLRQREEGFLREHLATSSHD